MIESTNLYFSNLLPISVIGFCAGLVFSFISKSKIERNWALISGIIGAQVVSSIFLVTIGAYTYVWITGAIFGGFLAPFIKSELGG